MSELRVEMHEMPAARLGPENPLPPLRAPRPVPGSMRFHESIPAEDRRYFGYGGDSGCLPYRLQDDYDRTRRPRKFRAAVLENDRVRATFLIELGGRLWSLVHKPPRGPTRELLYVNPVFQPGNLALRNAWFTGGVEWNGCVIGHSVFTCSPLFAARVRGEDGSPVLRLYEWHRVRNMPFQMDFFLPDGSDFLFARVRLVNPHDREVPTCWWSNIAVPEREDVRVLAPADQAFHRDYATGVRLSPIPVVHGVDRTYPTNVPHSGDFFFRIPEGHRPWIAAVGGDGRGLVQASTRRLLGRKLFVWGMGRGGRRWQDFLSEPGNPYIEIQAGLTRTQSGCLPMPAGAEWAWLEAYGPVGVDASVAHGSDWPAAWREVERHLDRALPQGLLEEELGRSARSADRPPEEILQRGSGWGALERLRRERAGEKPFCSRALVFDEASLGEEQRPWLALLREGELPREEPNGPPGSYMVQSEWRESLEAAVSEGRGDHWFSWLHLGVMRYQAGQPEEARSAWSRSAELEPSPWAYRNLAVLAHEEGRPEEAADFAKRAHEMAPQLRPLAVECCRMLLEAGRPREMLEMVEALPPEIRGLGRIRVLQAQAAFRVGELDKVEETLRSPFQLTDIREGERVLTQLWFAVHAKRIVEREGPARGRAPAEPGASGPARGRAPAEPGASGPAIGEASDEELDRLYERVQSEFPPPEHIDFRMSTGPAGKAHPDARRLWRRLLK